MNELRLELLNAVSSTFRKLDRHGWIRGGPQLAEFQAEVIEAVLLVVEAEISERETKARLELLGEVGREFADGDQILGEWIDTTVFRLTRHLKKPDNVEVKTLNKEKEAGRE